MNWVFWQGMMYLERRHRKIVKLLHGRDDFASRRAYRHCQHASLLLGAKPNIISPNSRVDRREIFPGGVTYRHVAICDFWNTAYEEDTSEGKDENGDGEIDPLHIFESLNIIER